MQPATQGALTPTERDLLLHLSRSAIVECATSGVFAPVNESNLTPALREHKGCFVTLTRNRQLRGCIGNLVPQDTLFRAVMNNACSAAFSDTRFEPLGKSEIGEVKIEISVLTEPEPLAFASPEELLRKLRPGVDGVVLRVAGRGATFLPQVWEKIPDSGRFMEALTRKARLRDSAWRETDAAILIFQVESFEEARPGN